MNTQKNLEVEVFKQTGDPVFLCEAYGKCTVKDLEEIESECEEERENLFVLGDGTYRFEAVWVSAQTNEYGRVELPAYWELSLLSYQPLERDGGAAPIGL